MLPIFKDTGFVVGVGVGVGVGDGVGVGAGVGVGVGVGADAGAQLIATRSATITSPRIVHLPFLIIVPDLLALARPFGSPRPHFQTALLYQRL